MIYDFIMNITIVASFLLVIGQIFKSYSLDSKYTSKAQILLGVSFGTLGIVLMLFTIKITDTVILDLRLISIMCAGIMGGPAAALLAAALTALFRILLFGISTTSISALFSVLLTGAGIAYISGRKLSTRNKYIFMLVFSLLVSSGTIFFLLGDKVKLFETLSYYWPVFLFCAILAYFTCEYIISVNTSFAAMAYYRMMAENLSDVIYSQKPDGSIVSVTMPILQLLGYTQDEFVGTSVYDYIHPDDAGRIKELYVNYSKTNEDFAHAFRMRRKDGAYVWVEASVKSLKNDDGSIKEMICVVRDISLRKDIEQEFIVSNARLKAILNNAGTGIVLESCDGNLIDANPAYLQMMGYSIEELKNLTSIIHPDDYQGFRESTDNLVKGKCSMFRSEIRYINKKRQTIFADVASTLIPGTEHTPTTIIRIVNNITERKKMEEKIKASEERFRTAFNNAAIGMYLSSVDGILIKVNNALCELTGYTEEELVSMSFSYITHPDDVDKDVPLMKQLLSGEILKFLLEKRYIHKNGSIIWALLGVSLVYDAENRAQYLIGQIQDITSRKKTEEELEKAKLEAERLASTDYLTGILNRRAFTDRFIEEFHRAGREKSSISLVLADIDHFKKVNDLYGHQVGDLALQKFARCLSSVCRSYDFVGRFGGEEFVVCLPNTNRKQAVKIAERMRKAVEDLNINLVYKKEPIKITASFGVASPILGSEESIDSLIMQADKAMYNAKVNGRNRVCTADE